MSDQSKQAEQLEEVDLPNGMAMFSVLVDDCEVAVIFWQALTGAMARDCVSPLVAVVVTNNEMEHRHIVQLELRIDTPPHLAATPAASAKNVSLGVIKSLESRDEPDTALEWQLNTALFDALESDELSTIHLDIVAGSGRYTSQSGVFLLSDAGTAQQNHTAERLPLSRFVTELEFVGI